MKLFIKKIGLFILISSLILVIFFYLCYNSFSKINGDEIFLGDSRINKSFNSNKNYGMGSENTFFTFYKIQRIIKYNKIKTIYLEFDEHSICGYYKSETPKVIGRYFENLPFPLQFKNIFVVNYPTMIVERILSINEKGNSIIGRFEEPPSKSLMNLKIVKKTLKKHYQSGISNLNIEYFRKIVNLCKLEKINLIIIKSPVHPFYFKNIPELHRKHYRILTKDLKVINLENLFSGDNYFLPDGHHLSKMGQLVFTDTLNYKLKLRY